MIYVLTSDRIPVHAFTSSWGALATLQTTYEEVGGVEVDESIEGCVFRATAKDGTIYVCYEIQLESSFTHL
jgi:hypothetical protein